MARYTINISSLSLLLIATLSTASFCAPNTKLSGWDLLPLFTKAHDQLFSNDTAQSAAGLKEMEKLAIEQDHSTAYLTLASYYRPKDDKKAAKWFSKATKDQPEMAHYSLALLYEHPLDAKNYKPRKATDHYVQYLKTRNLDPECPVCFEQLIASRARQENISTVCQNRHLFHLDCIKNWQAQNRSTCPLCRKQLFQLPAQAEPTMQTRKRQRQ